jgi:hypothetical protein
MQLQRGVLWVERERGTKGFRARVTSLKSTMITFRYKQ